MRKGQKITEAIRSRMSEAQKKSCNTKAEKIRRSIKQKENINNNGHPKGMLGKKHSTKTRKELSNIMKSRWSDDFDKLNSEENKQRLSDNLMKLQATGEVNKNSRGDGRKRVDLNNKYFRSKWEANFARYLNFLKLQGNIFKWEYEPDTFWFDKIKRGTRSYMPDFKVWDSKDSIPFYYEVKGWMDQRSKTKLKRMTKYYPKIKIIIIGEKEYKAIRKDIKSLIPNWEGA